MKILVTGGAGFIGSNFITHILAKYNDHEVINLDKLTYAGNIANCERWESDARYTFVKGDICDDELVNGLMPQVDAVVHFAAESHVDRSVHSAAEFVMTNVVGTQVLLDAAVKHGKKRFHHISTDEVFGQLKDRDEKPFDEMTAYDPRSAYSASKAAADHLVRAFYHTHDLPITISNCSNNYGPYHHPEKLFPLAITHIIEGIKVPVYGDGSQVRDWLHVGDHCSAIDLILHDGTIGETYLIGGDNQESNMDALKKIIALMEKNPDDIIEFVTDRPGHDFRYDVDYGKIRKELGWEPLVTLDEGLAEKVRWYTENEKWWRDVKSGAYQKFYDKNYSEQE